MDRGVTFLAVLLFQSVLSRFLVSLLKLFPAHFLISPLQLLLEVAFFLEMLLLDPPHKLIRADILRIFADRGKHTATILMDGPPSIVGHSNVLEITLNKPVITCTIGREGDSCARCENSPCRNSRLDD